MNETKNQKQNPAPQVKSPGGFGMGFLVATIIFLVILILAGAALGGWWYYKNHIKKSVQQVEQQMRDQAGQLQTPQNSQTIYINNTFGFKLTMTPNWKEYKAKEETSGGDFEVGRISFSLPTAEKNWMAPDMPGYFNAFVISACVKDSWDETVRANKGSMPMGEEVGRNNLYVFVWSHFNGDPPSDVSLQAVRDMQTIVDGIEVFNVGGAPTSSADVSYASWKNFTNSFQGYKFSYPASGQIAQLGTSGHGADVDPTDGACVSLKLEGGYVHILGKTKNDDMTGMCLRTGVGTEWGNIPDIQVEAFGKKYTAAGMGTSSASAGYRKEFYFFETSAGEKIEFGIEVNEKYAPELTYEEAKAEVLKVLKSLEHI